MLKVISNRYYRGRMFSSGSVAPSTSQFTGAQLLNGIVGSHSTTQNAARIYLDTTRGGWAGYITGTDALLTATSDFGQNAGMIEVSINGGAFSAAPLASGKYTLFSGQPQATRFVVWRIALGYGTAAYILSGASNVLEVTGAPPSIEQPTARVQPAVNDTNHAWSVATVANAANFVPPLSGQQGSSWGSNTTSLRFRTAATTLSIASNSRYVFVSINGAAPTRYDLGSQSPNMSLAAVKVTGLSGAATDYNVWTGQIDRSGGGTLTVLSDAALVSIGTKRRLDQYGDSITFGASSTSCGDVETHRVAAALGLTGSTSGISGYTIAQLDTWLDTLLPARTVTSNDVAVLAIGRNNVTGDADPLDAAEIAGYTSCINKLVAKGYGKVLCRGIIPTGNGVTTFTAGNASIQTIVTGLGNPNVIFVPTNTWAPFGTPDNVHPNDAGYATLAGFAQAAYAPLI